jgi:hypothetical protein
MGHQEAPPAADPQPVAVVLKVMESRLPARNGLTHTCLEVWWLLPLLACLLLVVSI